MRALRTSLPMLSVMLVASSARADEGMWTFDNFPKQELAKKYGVKIDDQWLEHVRLSSARLAQGCSASFVSPQGLVMTNHHCAHACIEQLSTPERDLVKSGFLARGETDELKCPALEVNQLFEITDVTERVRKATAGLTGRKYNEAEKAEQSRIEQACAAGPDSAEIRCDVVTLYRGGVYKLYKYRRFQDVRLVFAPELAIAFFGGDPDNFNFPRYNLDLAFLRVWKDGKPAPMQHHLRWSPSGVREGDVTFVSGHPGGTSRQLTVAQLDYLRDIALPDRLIRLAELRGFLTEYQRRGPEQRRHSSHLLFSVENAFKALRGRHAALVDREFFSRLVAQEQALRAAVAARPDLQKQYGDAWESIARAQAALLPIRVRYNMLEQGQGFQSRVFDHARTILRGAEERTKPLDRRFREFRDSALPAVTQSLFSPAPIHDELEIATLAFSLSKLREALGADDPLVRQVLGKESPEELATRLLRETKLKDPAVRRALWEGGAKAVAASTDPFIRLARVVDPASRAVRKTYEDEVEAPMKANAEKLARARFALFGTSTYPDATFTLRLNYGQVKGWTEDDGRKVPPFTVLGGAFARATGRPPYELPPSWIGARSKLNLNTPFNMATTNDIIGGNSGSPVIDKNGAVVGLVFDGNIHSLGGDYGFDPAKNRAVSVDSRAIIETLGKVYGADRLVKELTAPPQR